jgi:hypothetical protein
VDDFATEERAVLQNLPAHLRRYLDLRGNWAQVVQLVAVMAGHKPVLDEVVPSERLADFRKHLEGLGLFVMVECQNEFIEDPKDAEWIVGGSHFNTTRALAHSPRAVVPGAYAHVLVARDEMALQKGMASSWYDLAAEGRLVHKPWIDHHRYGEWLGYPACCRDFFARHNDWNTDNSLYQAWRGTRVPDYRCNTIVKHSGFSYLCHLPCTFDCPASRELAARVSESLQEASPTLKLFVDKVLRRPYLVLSEWDAFGFEGAVEGTRRLGYCRVFAAPSNHPDRALLELLRRGDELELEEDVLRVLHHGRTVGTYHALSDRFGPQVPFIVDFGGRS